jgi:hypothetical protein
MQGSALHKHRTFYIAISPCMNTLDHEEILLTCFLQSRLDAKNPLLSHKSHVEFFLAHMLSSLWV